MADSPNNPNPDQPPLTVGDQEIERLLQQAETLTHEIVEDVGAQGSPDAATGNPAGQLGDVEPDAEAAVELVTQDVAQLVTVIAETGVDEPTTAPVEPAAEVALPVDDVSTNSTVNKSSNEASESAVDQDVESPDDAAVIESAEANDPEVVVAESVVQVDPSSAADDSTFATAPLESSHLTEEGEPPVADSTVAVVDVLAPRRTLAGWMKRATVYSARTIVFVVPNACIHLLLLLDWPFRGIGPGMKNALGVIGLITMLMGGVAMFAPTMMKDNPYAAMPPFPETKEVASSGHGTEAAKSGHGGEAKSGHSAEAPPPKAGSGHKSSGH